MGNLKKKKKMLQKFVRDEFEKLYPSWVTRFEHTSNKMGFTFTSEKSFTHKAIEWLTNIWGDLHLEYHKDSGWSVSTCYSNGSWSEDGWLTGTGSMASALLVAVEKTNTLVTTFKPSS